MSRFDEKLTNLKTLTPSIISGLMTDLNDRAVAITLTSLLEEAIGVGIACRFRHQLSEPELDSLFEGYGPLATLSAKITIGYALGALTTEMKHDLNIVKKLRNDFAHAYLPLTFKDQSIASRCGALKLTTDPKPEWEKSFGTGPRGQFVRSCAKILVLTLVRSAIALNEHAVLKKHRPEILRATNERRQLYPDEEGGS